MTTLKEILNGNLTYDSSWGIWAERINGQIVPESPARIGQMQFQNGGILDGFEFVGNNETLTDAISAEIDETLQAEYDFDDEWLAEQKEGAIDWLFETGYFDRE